MYVLFLKSVLRKNKEPKKGKPHVCAISTGLFKGECTIERVALVMNIVPCRELCLRGIS